MNSNPPSHSACDQPHDEAAASMLLKHTAVSTPRTPASGSGPLNNSSATPSQAAGQPSGQAVGQTTGKGRGSALCAGYEPIEGYVLQEPIGRGGFGEVWSALAPGGFMKAIKFVYGARDEKRAHRELRSLEHMTGVSHPFLLTLERYEFVDDRLMIVSELADGSLEDVFNRQIERGSCGIPRAALLSYLHDAADALDYLHEKFQLQHLDIKPGNLLLVGGHVKIADFGLLKDLRDMTSSVVGGLTPIYAPPEVFDGRPSQHSDQYSLAVMYQELLTGTRPFSGRTIAQLATQHVHSAPHLECLPASDRPIIARALEKNFERRYPSCRELVEALRTPRGMSVHMTPNGTVKAIDGDTKAGGFVPGEAHRVAAVENLPGLSGSSVISDPSHIANSLVVAIGGTGADVLVELQQRIQRLGGQPSERIDSVLIDTDQEKLHAIRLLEGPDPRSPCQTIYTPLRSPADYRDGGTAHLGTISRRWIYNVPRSRTTEGMRPLGRLAMVDHGRKIMETLRAAVLGTAADSPAPPTVYLVGSLSGGTGSGMLLDVAYLLRHLLDECEMEQSEIIPLFASSSVRPHARHPLGNADTAAALYEMLFYLKPENGYSGDRGAGWPSVPAARSPLHNAYLLPHGEDSEGTPRAAEIIAQYIWHSSQGAGEVLAAARQPAADEPSALPGSHSCTRSVGIAPLSGETSPDAESLAALLAHQTLLSWIGQPNEARSLAPSITERLGARCGFRLETFQQQRWQPWPSDFDARQSELRERIAALPISQTASDQAIATAFQTQIDQMRQGPPNHDQVQSRMTALRRELSVRLQDRRIDLTTAIEVVRNLIEQVRAEIGEVQSSAASCPDPAPSANPLSTANVANLEKLLEQRTLRLERLLSQAAHDGLLSRLQQLISQLQLFLAALTAQVTTVAAVSRQLEPQAADDSLNPLSAALRSQMHTHVASLHDALAARLLALPLIKPAGTLSAASLMQAAMETSLEHTRRMIATNGSPPSGPLGVTRKESIQAALTAVRPPLLELGGKQRMLLLVGSQRERDELQKPVEAAYAGPVTTAIVPGVQAALVHEAQGIPLQAMIERLLASLGGNQKIPSRLHSRIDVQWQRNPPA